MNNQTVEDIIKSLNERLIHTNENYMILDKDSYDVEADLKDIITISGDIKYYEGTLKAYVNLGAHYTLREEHEEALAYMKKAKTLVDYRLVSEKYYSEVSTVYMMYYADLIGDIKTATKYYKLGLKHAKKANDMVNVMQLKANYSSLLIDNGHFEDALKLLLEVSEYAELHNDFILRYIYESMGRAYFGINNPVVSMEWFQKAYEIAINEEDIIIQNCCIRGLAKIHMLNGKVDSALETIKKTVIVNQKGERIQDVFEATLEFGEIYYELGLYQEAYDEMVSFAEYGKTSNEKLGYRFYKLIALLASHLGLYEEAYGFEKLSHEKHIQMIEGMGTNQSQENIIEDYRAHVNRLKILACMGSDIAETNTLDEVIYLLNKKLKNILKLDIIAIGLVENERLNYNHYSLDGEKAEPISLPIVKNKSLLSWVLEHDEELFISDIREEYSKYVDRVRYISVEGIESDDEARSVMFKPIKIDGKIIGLFTIQSHDVDAYGANEYEVFRIVSSYVVARMKNEFSAK